MKKVKKMEIASKYDNLKNILRGYGCFAVALSGGVDSSFLLAAAVDAVGAENVVPLTATAPFVSQKESAEAAELCEKLGVSQMLCPLQMEMITGFTDNPVDRCYGCKKAIFSVFIRTSKALGLDIICEGSNVDDEGDYRPGLKALAELSVKSPLREAGLTKSEIRELSRRMGLSTAEKPSKACLASRIPYGEKITEAKLKMIETAEDYLEEKGFSGVRVRVHEGVSPGLLTARIEVSVSDISRIAIGEVREQIVMKFKELGFVYVSLDLEGFRSGSMNVGI